MKFLLLTLFTLSSAYAIDCGDFAADTAGLESKEKVEAANNCKENYIKQLSEKIQTLDQATNTCQMEIESLRNLVFKAREFYTQATALLQCEQPDEGVQQRMQRSMVDLIYALSERLDQRECSHMEYVEAKADAQLEVIILRETEVQEDQA